MFGITQVDRQKERPEMKIVDVTVKMRKARKSPG